MNYVYLASSFNWRKNLRQLGRDLISRGYRVSSSWIYLSERPPRDSEYYQDNFAPQIAKVNLADLEKSNYLILDARGIGEISGGGMHWEAGWAYAKGLPIVVIGNPVTSFYHLPGVHWVDDEIELFDKFFPNRLVTT